MPQPLDGLQSRNSEEFFEDQQSSHLSGRKTFIRRKSFRSSAAASPMRSSILQLGIQDPMHGSPQRINEPLPVSNPLICLAVPHLGRTVMCQEST